MSHNHHQKGTDLRYGDRRISIAIWANGLLTVAQIIGGLMSGSLALIADALHNFSDMASLVIAFAARKIARRPANERMTFGYGRVEIVAALINYVSLIIIGAYLVYEGIARLIDPPEVSGWTVVILGLVALVVDSWTTILTWSIQKDSVNIRALFLHNLSDALASVGVVVGGSFILIFGWWIVDPIVTLAIAVYILYLSFSEIGYPIRMLMLGTPEEIDSEVVLSALEEIDGVTSIHHAHLWPLQEGAATLDAHIVLSRETVDQQDSIKSAIKEKLHEQFGIMHSTLEFEHPDHVHEDSVRFGCYNGDDHR